MRTLAQKASDLVPVYCPSIKHLDRLDQKVQRMYAKLQDLYFRGKKDSHYYRHLESTINNLEDTIATGEKRRMAYGLDIYKEEFTNEHCR
jgi:hypothetical protein